MKTNQPTCILKTVFAAAIIIAATLPQAFSQNGVGINSTGAAAHGSAMLDVSSSSKGALLPRMTASQRTGIVSPAIGLIVYQTDTPEGYYFYSSSGWIALSTSTGTVSGTGAATRVAFWNGTNSLSSSNNLYWDNTNSRLGIGTITPLEKLHVEGNALINTAGGNNLLLKDLSTGNGWGVGTANGGNLFAVQHQGILPDVWFGITNTGNVGIGTTTPEFKLSLANDGGIIATGTFGSGTALTTSGGGERMIWYPRKAAFRAGSASGTEWDDANIGIYSVAMGTGTTASGENSFAMGNSASATGVSSTALGDITSAGGDYSIAAGLLSVASGYGSIAMGVSNSASGESSVAIGTNSTASTYYATAIGANNTASGNSSTAMGFNSTASGVASVGIGSSVIASGNFSTAMGNAVSTNSQAGAFALGDNSTLIPMNAPNANSFNARFAGGYNLYTDAATTTANGLFFNAGNLGIGVVPANKLEVAGTTKTTNLQMTNGAGAGKVLTSDASGNATWQTAAAGLSGSGTPTQLAFWNGASSLSSSSNLYWDNTNSRLGIGTSAPTLAKLQVEGTAGGNTVGVFRANNTTSQGVSLVADWPGLYLNCYYNSGDFRTLGTTGYPSVINGNQLTGGGMDFLVSSIANTSSGTGIGSQLIDALSIKGSGNVGIGTTTPSQKLDVAGTTRTTNFQMTAGAAAGNVLTSDASGNASWQPASSITETDPQVSSTTANYIPKWNGTTLTDGTIYDNNGNIGIGTTTNTSKLFVRATAVHEVAIFEQGTPASFNADVWWAGGTGSTDWLISKRTVDGSNDFWFFNPGLNYSLLTLKQSGNIGIGTNSPAAKLDVNGSTRLRGLTAGYVKSDASGNLSNSATVAGSDVSGNIAGNAVNVTGTVAVTNGGTGTATAFTSGSIVFAGASGVYSQNNSNLFWDNTNSRLGIGTTTPSAPLTVKETSSGGCGYFEINNSGSTAFALTAISNSAGQSIYGFNSGTGRAAKFEINNPSSSSPALFSQTNGTGAAGAFFNTNSSPGASPALDVETFGGTGDAIKAVNAGTGNAGDFRISNASSTADVLYAKTTGTGNALRVDGVVAYAFANSQVAGTNNPDATARTWRYTSGAGIVTLPAASACNDREYVIVNATGSTLNISGFTALNGVFQTSFPSGTSVCLQSDGANWYQIK